MIKDKVAYWTDIVDYDLKTAEAMCQTGRWLYVAVMCHQVIEKTLKAYWCGTRLMPLLIRTTTCGWPRAADYMIR